MSNCELLLTVSQLHIDYQFNQIHNEPLNNLKKKTHEQMMIT